MSFASARVRDTEYQWRPLEVQHAVAMLLQAEPEGEAEHATEPVIDEPTRPAGLCPCCLRGE